jgi:F-type H+-transporting ATPase subunit alpha
MVEVLKQKNGQPLPLESQVVILYAATHKFFADVPVSQVTAVEKQFVEYMDGQHSKTLAEIRSSAIVSDDSKKELNRAMEEFKLAHADLFSAAK